jgi:hypothetical protein
MLVLLIIFGLLLFFSWACWFDWKRGIGFPNKFDKK